MPFVQKIQEVKIYGNIFNLFPYTDAVIHEIQRHMDLDPITIPHKIMCDTEYNGYAIPKVFYTLPPLHTPIYLQVISAVAMQHKILGH